MPIMFLHKWNALKAVSLLQWILALWVGALLTYAVIGGNGIWWKP
jgi:hypothetical protein